jgi:hypothetical protein
MGSAKLDALETGSLGIFYPWNSDGLDEAGAERGWIVRSGRWINVDALDESLGVPSLLSDESTTPIALLGQLPGTTVLVLELQDRGGSKVLGGERVSTRLYRSRSVAVEVPLSRLRSTNVRALQVQYLSLGRWAGIRTSSEQWQFDDDHRISSFELKLDSEDVSVSAALGSGLRIVLEQTWTVNGPSDDRRITAPISLRVESTRPRHLHELLGPQIHVQSLLGFLCSGHVEVANAHIELDLVRSDRPKHDGPVPLWTAPLCVRPEGVQPASDTQLPLMSLADLGGVAGLARWARLSEQHPRAVGPAVSSIRFGPSVLETELLSLGTALEYWVAMNRRRKVAWATATHLPRGTSAHRRIMESASLQAGQPFEEWVINRSAWCDDFSSSYERLKHDPSHALDYEQMFDLVISGRYLLFGLLADRAANSRAPTRRLFRHHRLQHVHERMDTRYA